MNTPERPFIRIDRSTGRIVWANMKDHRLWPWIVALILQHAKGQGDAFMRNRTLAYANRMATIRRVFYGPAGITKYAATLIDGCEVCGGRALYLRDGFVGRCRQHRDVTSTNEPVRRARLEARDAEIDRIRRERGSADRKRQAYTRYLNVTRRKA